MTARGGWPEEERDPPEPTRERTDSEILEGLELSIRTLGRCSDERTLEAIRETDPQIGRRIDLSLDLVVPALSRDLRRLVTEVAVDEEPRLLADISNQIGDPRNFRDLADAVRTISTAEGLPRREASRLVTSARRLVDRIDPRPLERLSRLLASASLRGGADLERTDGLVSSGDTSVSETDLDALVSSLEDDPARATAAVLADGPWVGAGRGTEIGNGNGHGIGIGVTRPVRARTDETLVRFANVITPGLDQTRVTRALSVVCAILDPDFSPMTADLVVGSADRPVSDSVLPVAPADDVPQIAASFGRVLDRQFGLSGPASSERGAVDSFTDALMLVRGDDLDRSEAFGAFLGQYARMISAQRSTPIEGFHPHDLPSACVSRLALAFVATLCLVQRQALTRAKARWTERRRGELPTAAAVALALAASASPFVLR